MTTQLKAEINELSYEQYSFNVSDEEEWSTFLEEQGFCVVRCVLDAQTVSTAIDYTWEDMCELFGAKRDDIMSWSKVPTGKAGIVNKALPQTRGPWIVRGNHEIKSIFAKIWQTEDLLVSMDSVIIWLPWWLKGVTGAEAAAQGMENKVGFNIFRKPQTEGLHLDQNPFSKPHRCCVQGMVPLIDVTDMSGGLEVVPGSHTTAAKEQFKRNHSFYRGGESDFCVVLKKSEADKHPVLLRARAGDLILWDSRTVHGGRVGTGETIGHELGQESVSVDLDGEIAETTSSLKTIKAQASLTDDVAVDTADLIDYHDNNHHCPHHHHRQQQQQQHLLYYQHQQQPQLARLSIPVCMTPRSAIARGKEQIVLRERVNAYYTGGTHTHWPHEAVWTYRAPESRRPVAAAAAAAVPPPPPPAAAAAAVPATSTIADMLKFNIAVVKGKKVSGPDVDTSQTTEVVRRTIVNTTSMDKKKPYEPVVLPKDVLELIGIPYWNGKVGW